MVTAWLYQVPQIRISRLKCCHLLCIIGGPGLAGSWIHPSRGVTGHQAHVSDWLCLYWWPQGNPENWRANAAPRVHSFSLPAAFAVSVVREGPDAFKASGNEAGHGAATSVRVSGAGNSKRSYRSPSRIRVGEMGAPNRVGRLGIARQTNTE